MVAHFRLSGTKKLRLFSTLAISFGRRGILVDGSLRTDSCGRRLCGCLRFMLPKNKNKKDNNKWNCCHVGFCRLFVCKRDYCGRCKIINKIMHVSSKGNEGIVM